MSTATNRDSDIDHHQEGAAEIVMEDYRHHQVEQRAHRQCVVPACGRRAASGSTVCWPHRKSPTGRDWDTAIRQAASDGSDAVAGGPDSAAAEQFRRRIALGQYRELFDVSVIQILAQAAASHDLDDEIGALRFTLARLIAEEQDPMHLALGVARVVRASVATSRERRELAQAKPDGLTEAMTRVLAELEAEEAEATASND